MTEKEKMRCEKSKKIFDAFIKVYPFDVKNLVGEEWRDIVNYEGLYQVSNFGRIKSLKCSRELIMRPCFNSSNGYLYVGLQKNKTRNAFRIHKLVAGAFIPNVKNLPEIDHIDGDKFNNCVENLRWVTPSENIRYAIERKRKQEGLPMPIWNDKPKSDFVFIRYKQVFTTSLKVAEYFGKRHDNVLRDIEEIVAQFNAEVASGLETSNLSFQKMFIKGEYEVKNQTRKYPMYYLNRDGFLLLAMGFTGQKAFHFKLAFIAEFNRMEKALKYKMQNSIIAFHDANAPYLQA